MSRMGDYDNEFAMPDFNEEPDHMDEIDRAIKELKLKNFYLEKRVKELERKMVIMYEVKKYNT